MAKVTDSVDVIIADIESVKKRRKVEWKKVRVAKGGGLAAACVELDLLFDYLWEDELQYRVHFGRNNMMPVCDSLDSRMEDYAVRVDELREQGLFVAKDWRHKPYVRWRGL